MIKYVALWLITFCESRKYSLLKNIKVQNNL